MQLIGIKEGSCLFTMAKAFIVLVPLVQLHHPSDEGLDEFWVDFNTATSSMSLYTEDVGALSEGGAGDDMWESVIVKSGVVQEWSVTSELMTTA